MHLVLWMPIQVLGFVSNVSRVHWAKGRTIILVTHAVTLMLPTASYAVVMNNGEVSAQGAPLELKERGQILEPVEVKGNGKKILQAPLDENKEKERKEED